MGLPVAVVEEEANLLEFTFGKKGQAPEMVNPYLD